MSAKPTTPFTWATSGLRVAASIAKRAVGFVTRERPPAQILNDCLGHIGEWIVWLNDGDVDFNTLEVANDTQLDGDLNVLGAAQFGSLLGPVILSGTGIANASISDSATHNDFTASGIGGATLLELTISGPNNPTITSILTSGNRQLLWILVSCNDPAGAVTFEHAASTGTVSQRLLLPNETDLVFPNHGAALFYYDATDTRWKVLAKNF